MSTLDHRRWSTGTGCLATARLRRNLTIAPNYLVRRVLMAGPRATGVEVEGDGVARTIAGDEVILCAGAVGSAQLLLQSGVGPGELLRQIGIPVIADVAGVGQNLTDHPTVAMLLRTKSGVTLDGEAPLRQVALRYTAVGSGRRNDMKINLQSYNTDLATGVPIGVSMRATISLSAARGELRINANLRPVITLNFLADEFDRQRLRESMRLCDSLAARAPFRELIDKRLSPTDADLSSDEALDLWLWREVSTSHHLAGTCKMGPSTDGSAVVDQFGKVHGIESLRVVDASIMPTSVRANTNLTTMMLAERMTEFILAGQ